LEDIAAQAASFDNNDDDDCDSNDFDQQQSQEEMEISPGVYVPFRGAKETWHAVAKQRTVEVTCLDCCQVLVCINDCEYTVCPDCRVVNPVLCFDTAAAAVDKNNKPKQPFGVGMGFKQEWVRKKQIVNRQNEAALEAKTRRIAVVRRYHSTST